MNTLSVKFRLERVNKMHGVDIKRYSLILHRLFLRPPPLSSSLFAAPVSS